MQRFCLLRLEWVPQKEVQVHQGCGSNDLGDCAIHLVVSSLLSSRGEKTPTKSVEFSHQGSHEATILPEGGAEDKVQLASTALRRRPPAGGEAKKGSCVAGP